MIKIFLSHIHEESELAHVLKGWIESTFTGRCTVFVSSAPGQILSGHDWLAKVKAELAESKLIISLYSPQASTRHWISFEAGCGWIKEIPIIAICHSGLSNLPKPLDTLQSLDITKGSFAKTLFGDIAEHCGLDRNKIPRIALNEFMDDMNNAIAAIHSSASAKVENRPRFNAPRRFGANDRSPTLPVTAKAYKPTENQMSILIALEREFERDPMQAVAEGDLARELNQRISAIRGETKDLAVLGHVHASTQTTGERTYRLTDSGCAEVHRLKLIDPNHK